MEFADYMRQITVQTDALRAAAVAAGPETAVPTCPGWTVAHLVGHAGGAQRLAMAALAQPPDAKRPGPIEPPPSGWDELLDWWDTGRANLIERLTEAGPDRPCWSFDPGAGSSGFWVRRAAHEAAIHRLDAEHARTGDTEPIGLLFDPEFAADGIDEELTALLPVWLRRKPDQVTSGGTALWHAADAGRVWLVEVRPGHYSVSTEPRTDGLDEDVTVAGSADSVYRRAWGRPSTAVVTGDETVLAALRSV